MRLELGRVVTQDTLRKDLRLALAEETDTQEGHRLRSRAREQGEEDEAAQNGEETLKQEKPLPATEAADSSHVKAVQMLAMIMFTAESGVYLGNLHAIGKKARAGRCKHVANEVEGEPLASFLPLIPASDGKKASWDEA